MGSHSVDNFVRVNLACPKMIKTILIISAVIACINADVFTATKTFIGKDKKGKNKKTITCEIKIDYSGDSADKAGTSVDCSYPNENKKNDEIKSTTKTLNFGPLGDVTGTLFSAEVKFTFSKNKKKNSVTKLNDVESVPYAGDASFGPVTLWCPEENTLVYGTGAYDSIVNEASADSWDQCAQRCAEFTNDNGNAPCFSWTFNSNSESVNGLGGGICRLLAYMEVSSIVAEGVQSGYHKCWKAYSTSQAP